MSSFFFTGFPGFLGSELLACVLRRSPHHRAVCLVQSKFLAQATECLKRLEDSYPAIHGRTRLAVGDITDADLGIDGLSRLRQDTSEIFHLAAVYDLAVSRELAMRVNVQGTQNVLRFAETCPTLRRLHYVSTCYVSGRHPGTFSETDLDCGQTFHNFYEETKYLAEVEVQARMRDGLSATVYRPAIVVGDSCTGATQKYDGPYFVIRWLLRQPSVALMPIIRGPASTEVNLVPRDFVVRAISYLSGVDASAGKVYQLADPSPLTVRELLTVLGRATCRRVVVVPLPRAVAKFSIDYVPGVYRLMQIPSPAIDYFVHPTHYSCDIAVEDLKPSGLVVPAFSTYVENLVDFVRKNPGLGSCPMS